ncbi:MAG: T9SS type A sorting domain-containing protein [Lutibacter sp.]
MKKQLFIITMLIFIGLSTKAQTTFQKTYGQTYDNVGYSVQQTTDGGYIIGGCTSNLGWDEENVYLIRTNSFGDTIWTKTFGGTAVDQGFSVMQTTDAGYVIAGTANSFEPFGDVYLVKTNVNGDTLWTKTYGGPNSDAGNAVQQTTDGGFIIAGSTSSFGVTVENVYLIKTDVNGDAMWTRTFGGSGFDYDEAYSVQQTTDGGYIIVGKTTSFGAGYYDVYLIKTDDNGDLIWSKTFGGMNDDYGMSVKQTTDGGYIIAGYTKSFGAGNYDVYLIKVNANGNMLWSKTFGGPNIDVGNAVQQTTDGGFIIAGSTEENVYLIKTDVNGDMLWSKTFTGFDVADGKSIQQTTDGGYIISGRTNVLVYLIKTDSNGNSGCFEGNFNTTQENPATQVMNPATQVYSGGFVTSPYTIVNSGCTVVTLCTSIGIDEHTIESDISIYPNPFTSIITIAFNEEQRKATIKVMDLLGKEIRIINFTGQLLIIEKGEMSNGIYFFQIIDEKKNVVNKKIVIQ